MGSHGNLNRSFTQTQNTFTQLMQQYTSYGFTQNQILRAWQQCGAKQSLFHDELIRVSNEDNARIMTGEQLQQSQFKFKNHLKTKEEDELKKAIQLSLEDQQPLDSVSDLEKQFKTTQVPTGLRNIGNTCYMNIMLQYMFHLIPFREMILSLEIPEKECLSQQVILKLQQLFALQYQGSRVYVSPQEFFEALQKFKPNTMMVKGLQNDYYELQVAFLDAIETALKEIANEQLVKQFQQIFYGESEEILSYKEKNEEAVKINKTSFGSINIDAQDKDLETGFSKTRLLIIDEYETDNGEKSKARIEQNIITPPSLLSFYINRVYYDQRQKCTGKNNTSFDFPKQLNINEFKSCNPKAKQSAEMEDLLREEKEILDQLKRCGEDDEEELYQKFEQIIRLFKRSDGQINQYITLDDFIVCDTNTFNKEMIDSASMLKQLELYKDSFVNRRKVLKKQFENLQQKKKQLSSSKQNLYLLTAVLMHDGSAESGHYYCYILDKSDQVTWWKFNDRIVTKTDYTTVYFDATGKNRINSNVSGLIYEQSQSIATIQQFQLQPKLQQFLQEDLTKLKKQIDKSKIINRKSSILYRAQNLGKSQFNQNQNFILQILEIYNNFELYLKCKPQQYQQLYDYEMVRKSTQVEIQNIVQELHFPQNVQEYIKFFLTQSRLFPSNIQQTYEVELAAFTKYQQQINQISDQILSPQITYQNYERVLFIVQQALEQFKQNEQLTNAFKLLFYSILLKGGFICDLLIQKQMTADAQRIAQALLATLKENQGIKRVISDQVNNNLKKTIEQMEFLKMSKDNIKQMKQVIHIQPPSIIAPKINSQKDLSDTIEKFREMIKNLELWISFVIQIEKSNKILDQQERLNKEMILYFE